MDKNEKNESFFIKKASRKKWNTIVFQEAPGSDICNIILFTNFLNLFLWKKYWQYVIFYFV